MTKFEPASRFAAESSASNHFSWIRTRLSIERTFMAWIRTGISLIGFGFTIVQFFQRMQGMDAAGDRTMPEMMPRNLGLALIATGVAGLAMSAWQYHQQIMYLWDPAFAALAAGPKPKRTPAFIAAMVLIVIGIAAFVSVFFHFM